ncbi:MAG: HD domain-containing protein [Bacteroidales bacterium]|jgi:HD superfamily phosphodiesterase
MKITGIIESAEKQYKQILEDFFISVYNEKSLTSHGIDHHRRVWNYSKELLELIPLKNIAKTSQLASELIIASYLHDIGMSVDPGVNHGGHSRDLCAQFLIKNNLPQNDWQVVLEAIENHDNKDYTSNTSMSELLKILSVADDLDAFGYTGIFRYSEIYLTRGIDPKKIGYMIMENAEKRFDNFAKAFRSDSAIVQKHKERYNVLYDFFSKYNEQLPNYHFGTVNLSGFCGVIEIILFMMNNGLQLKNFFTEQEKYSKDPVIIWYFSELQSELLVEHTVL